jgi:hypothetical protein
MEVENQEGQGPLWAVLPLMIMNVEVILNLRCQLNFGNSFCCRSPNRKPQFHQVVSDMKNTDRQIWLPYGLFFRRLIAGLTPRRSGFTPGSIYVGSVVVKVALGQVFLRVLRDSPVNIIPPWFSTQYVIWGMRNRPVRGRSSETVSYHRHE